MATQSHDLVTAAAVGVAATAVMDLAGEALRRTRGLPTLDYALLGRWVGHMRRGRFHHADIGATEPVANERALGWFTHYSIGTGFAVALAVGRPGWLCRPTMFPALATGLGTTMAPWLILQPAFGVGFAASRAPRPGPMRLHSLRAHSTYGIGLWLSGRLIRTVTPTRWCQNE